MIKIIAKYVALMAPVLCAIVILQYMGTREETDVEALESIVSEEYIIDLSKEGVMDWGNNKEGSAKFLAGRTGIITFFVGDSVTEWTKSDMTTVCDKLNTAAAYLNECGKKYKQDVKLIYNMSDMMFYEKYEGTISDWEKDNYTKQVYNWIDKDVNCEYLISKYDLDGLAFLVVLNGAGVSYAIPHDIEDGKSNYYEVAYIYLFDSEYPDRYECPAAYAHELLHLFGAVDLYDYEHNPISYPLEAYISMKHPNEIMYTTYLNGNISLSKNIEQEFSDITAYSVGFLSDSKEIQQYPELKKTQPACFSENDGRVITFIDEED